MRGASKRLDDNRKFPRRYMNKRMKLRALIANFATIRPRTRDKTFSMSCPPPQTIREPETRPQCGPFFFLVQRGLTWRSDFRRLAVGPNLSLNAPCLFSPALRPNRDAFKIVRLFRCLVKLDCAAVEAGSTAIDANRDTRRRRDSSKRYEWSREVFDDKQTFRS